MIGPRIQFQSAEEEDRAFYIHVHHTAYRSAIEEMFGWDESVQNGFANSAFDGGGIHLIWFEEGRIGVVGWDLMVDCLWLKELYILPEFQRRGIGSYVVQEAIKRSIEVGKNLRLRTLRVNIGAKKLYERLGLLVIHETDIHWTMERSITH